MSQKINRRHLLAGAAGAAATGAVFQPAAPAYAKGRVRLKQVTTWPKNFPGLGTAPENIARRVEAMSDGELKIKIYAAGELVGALEAFDAVATGVADMYNGAEYYWQGKDPVFAFFTTWPFGMTAVEFAAWIHFGGGQELWDELTAKFNVKSFLSADSGTQSGGWFNKPINSVEDFKGLKCACLVWVARLFAGSAHCQLFCLEANSMPPCNRARLMRQNGWAHGMTLQLGFIRLGNIFIHPAFMNPMPHWQQAST